MKHWGVLMGLLLCPLLASAQELSKQLDLPLIGYASVQDAYDSLSADENASKSEYEGWTLFTQKVDGKYILWSFTPENHPVHPSAVRRDVVNKNGEVSISMAVMCHASRFDCDQLSAQFEQINERLKQKFAGDPGS
jgi:hypothetical protein